MNDRTAAPTGEKKHGCFFYGCIISLILAVILGVASFLAVRYAINKVNAFIVEYTETTPAPLPKVEVTQSAWEVLDQRLTAFQEALDARKQTPPLVLTSSEINAFMAKSPAMSFWKDKLYVTIDGNEVKGQISLPLDELGEALHLSKLKGRYLNGSAALRVSLQNGQLVVNIQSLQVKGRSPPEQVMASLRAENLARDLDRDPKNAAMIQKFESIEVKDSKVTVKAKAKE